MTTMWMLYAAAVAALLSAAAWAAERVLRLYDLPARWVWVGAAVASVALPLAVYLAPARATSGAALGAVLPVLSVQPAAGAPAGGDVSLLALLAPVDGILLWLWGAASLAVLAYLALACVRLNRRRGGWREAEVDGVAVLVSEATGPAVSGFAPGRIVLPRWVLESDEATRRLILAHEAEHLAARDPWLLALALATLAAAPWSPAAWWQLRRLRLAMELDCDARVLRRHRDLHGYARLLLDVGERGSGRVLAAAFAEPRSLLERRIRALTAVRPQNVRGRALLAGAGAAVLLAAACLGPQPDRASPTEVVGPPRAAQAPASAPRGEPYFTPFTIKPELVNRDEVVHAITADYPPLLKQAGVGGRAIVWVHLDRTGAVAEAQIKDGTGHDELDAAALRIAQTMRFTPARDSAAQDVTSHPVPVWIALPIVFKADAKTGTVTYLAPPGSSGKYESQPDRPSTRVVAGPTPSAPFTATPDGPAFTPYTVKPELANRDEVKQALQANYPPLLRNAGVQGRALVWVHLDATGAVTGTRIKEGSGHDALDAAALRVAGTMRFTPARDHDRPVPVWIVLPIAFQTSQASH